MIHIAETAQLQTLSFAVASAKHTIWAFAYNVSAPHTRASPQFKQLWQTLKDQAQRGIDCRLILPSLADSSNLGDWAHNSLADLHSTGWKMRRVGAGRLQHSKSWLIDGRIGILTSANLTDTALSNNIEHMSLAEGSKDCQLMMTTFMQHWTTSKKIEATQWRE